MSESTIVIVGAGRIGRGFAADLFDAAGYRIVFVEKLADLVANLRQAQRYTIVRAENAQTSSERLIAGFTAIATAQAAEVDSAIVNADLLAVAVFPKDFPDVAQELAPGLLRRCQERPDAPLDIILFTNLSHPGPLFRAQLDAFLPAEARAWAEAHLGLVESVVVRIATEGSAEELARDPLLVLTSGYAELPVDRHAFKGSLPTVPGLRAVDDIRAEETRKLYTYNTFHAALAYFGSLHGYAQIVDCMADPAACAPAEAALQESSAALQAEYGFTRQEMDRWIAGLLADTNNPALSDTVARCGADPRRKLQRADRLIGPLLMARKHGLPGANLARAAAAGLLFKNPGDAGVVEVQAQVAAHGVAGAVQRLCQLTAEEEDVVDAIVAAYWDFRR